MRIHIRISMPRKMFGYRQYSPSSSPWPAITLLATFTGFSPKERVLITDFRVDVDIRHRSKIHLYAEFPALPCHFPAILIEQGIVLYTSQYHILRKDGCTPQTHGKSPLTVERNQQRNIRHALRFIRQAWPGLHQSAGKQQTADFIILDNLAQQLLVALVLMRGDCIDKSCPIRSFRLECALKPNPPTACIAYHPLPTSPATAPRGNNGRCRRTTFRIRSKTPATSHYNQYKQ